MSADRGKSSSTRSSSSSKHDQEKRGNSFQFHYLGSSSLALNKTGFGSVQGALKDLYIPFITQRDSPGRKSSVVLREDGLVLNIWNQRSRQYQEEFYPYDFVTYVDYIKFGVTKGKKRYFGYFCRYRDKRDALPDSVLIPIDRRHKVIIKMNHPPLVVCVLRRPRGVQFLDCHVMLADSEFEARTFYEIAQSRTAPKTQPHQSSVTNIDDITFHGEISNLKHRWKSQPKLTTETTNAQSVIHGKNERRGHMRSIGDANRRPSDVAREGLFARLRNRQVSSGSGSGSKWSSASVSSGSSYTNTDRRTSTTSSFNDEDSVFTNQSRTRLLRAKSDTNLLEGVNSYLIPIDFSDEPQYYRPQMSERPAMMGKVSQLIDHFDSEFPHRKPVAMIRPSRRASDIQHGHKHPGRSSPRRIKRMSSNRKENSSYLTDEATESVVRVRNEQHAKVTKKAEIEEDVFSMNFGHGPHDFQSALGYLP